jgi:ribosomal protein L32
MKRAQEVKNVKSMTKCPKCGELLASDNEAKCPKCGTALNTSNSAAYQKGSQQSQVVLYPKDVTKNHSTKPKLIIGLSAISALGTAESFAYFAKINLNPSLGMLSTLTSWVPSYLVSYMPYFVGLAGFLFLASAFGYFKRTRWAWKVGLVSSVVGVASIFAPNLFGFVAGAVSLALLFTNPVKHWLHHN